MALKDKTLQKKYKVLRVEREFNDIEMILHELPPLPKLPREKPETEEYLRNVIASPVPKNDEERQVMKMMDAFKKYAPGVAETLTVPCARERINSAVGPAITSLVGIELHLSLSDYVKLGKPTVEDVIEISLKKIDEA